MELGFGEIVIVFIIALLLFGPSKLPQLGESLGRAIRSFKDAVGSDGPPRRPAPAHPAELPAPPPPPTAAAPPAEAGPTARDGKGGSPADGGEPGAGPRA